MSYEKTGRRSDKFSRNTKISQAFKIQPPVAKKSYGAIEQEEIQQIPRLSMTPAYRSIPAAVGTRRKPLSLLDKPIT